jgi:hypothetical protein
MAELNETEVNIINAAYNSLNEIGIHVDNNENNIMSDNPEIEKLLKEKNNIQNNLLENDKKVL